eukprot:TRINITY_DN44367_c0_g1_i1.p1 TRINITY_DN44367_c0_g1~~TRINITY_DN44367_c0_g1_i1.p1  ORF type:complete len:729 (+),score=102.38 TRINITY_DN44367_c0_g1_i1:142-2328(+)
MRPIVASGSQASARSKEVDAVFAALPIAQAVTPRSTEKPHPCRSQQSSPYSSGESPPTTLQNSTMTSPPKPARRIGTWQSEEALGSLRYHTRLVLMLLEKLDLPFSLLQEFRLGSQRHRRAPIIDASAGDTDSPPRWRTAPWGAIYLVVEPCCPLWQADSARSFRLRSPSASVGHRLSQDGERDPKVLEGRSCSRASTGCSLDDARSTPAVSAPSTDSSVSARHDICLSFGCVSSDEASVVAEAETHICAALRHLARASAREDAAHLVMTARWSGSGASLGRVGFEAVDPLRDDAASTSPVSSDECFPGGSTKGNAPSEGNDGTMHTAEMERLATPEARQDYCHGDDLCGHSGQHNEVYSGEAAWQAARANSATDGGSDPHGNRRPTLPPSFSPFFDRLVDVAWVFFLRMRLADALLHGDLLRSATCAVRLLGLGEPWKCKIVQEFVVLTLEFVAEKLTASHISEICAGGERCSEQDSFRGFQEACALYLIVPIIPRFEARLRRCVRGLSKSGAFTAHVGGIGSSLKAALSEISSWSEGHGDDASRPQFDESGKGLKVFRASDPLHRMLREALASAVDDHSAGACTLDAARVAVAGAEALMRLNNGPSWTPENRWRFINRVGSVPGPQLDADDFLDFDDILAVDGTRTCSDTRRHAEVGNGTGIVLEDVSVDLMLVARGSSGGDGGDGISGSLPLVASDEAARCSSMSGVSDKNPWGMCCSPHKLVTS